MFLGSAGLVHLQDELSLHCPAFPETCSGRIVSRLPRRLGCKSQVGVSGRDPHLHQPSQADQDDSVNMRVAEIHCGVLVAHPCPAARARTAVDHSRSFPFMQQPTRQPGSTRVCRRMMGWDCHSWLASLSESGRCILELIRFVVYCR